MTTHGYPIEKCGDGKWRLMHGQRTPGHNNGVPVRSLAEADKIASAWAEQGLPRPYPPALTRPATL